MQVSINRKSKHFEEELYNLINNCELPISNVYYIFKLTFNEIEKLYYGALNEESMEQSEDLTDEDLLENKEEITKGDVTDE